MKRREIRSPLFLIPGTFPKRFRVGGKEAIPRMQPTLRQTTSWSAPCAPGEAPFTALPTKRGPRTTRKTLPRRTWTMFLRSPERRNRFQDDEHLKAWLLCVAINRCRDLHRSGLETTRRTHRRGSRCNAKILARRCGTRPAGQRARTRPGCLPDKMRLIVHLHYEGFSTEEIAACTARPWFARA